MSQPTDIFVLRLLTVKKSPMDTVKWSNLPKELWPIIGKFLHSRIDVLRFRSVCSIWRSSRPPFQRPPAPPRPALRFSPAAAGEAKSEALLFQSTTYRMESLTDDDRCCSSQSKPWLMQLEEDLNSGEMRLLHPVTNSPLRYSPNSTSMVFNLLDFRLVELRKSHGLKFGKNNVDLKSVHKLVVMPCDHLGFGDECVMFMLYNEGKLGFARFGDEKLTHVDEQNSHYDDIIVYKDQCYVVDKWGTISWVSSALQVIQFSPPLCGFGGRKYLVECRDDLYVVDQFFEKVSYHHERGMLRYQGRDLDNELIFGQHHNSRSEADAVDFKVYKLDQEWGKWINVRNLGDQVFILSNDVSFSVSAREFAGVKGNCIFFVERVASPGRAKRDCSRVFNLEDGRIRNLASWCGSQMVQPPSTWLGPD
ncbi:putative F-box protein At1g65770 isoform X1 [Rosa chinensis]|nr:putative F-box protein At1g65770 isoform X1 [Rosa chinensis]XP_024181757.2 putative F-box protein At1g65770 isoform X1 [Rosa chinensis]